MRKILLVVTLCLWGCASVPLTEDEEFEREAQRAYDLENWAMCEEIYRQYGKPTFHNGHLHGERDRIRPHDIKSDLMVNGCRLLLGEHWAD